MKIIFYVYVVTYVLHAPDRLTPLKPRILPYLSTKCRPLIVIFPVVDSRQSCAYGGVSSTAVSICWTPSSDVENELVSHADVFMSDVVDKTCSSTRTKEASNLALKDIASELEDVVDMVRDKVRLR